MRINDSILGLIIIAFSAFVLVEARTYQALPGVPYGPGLFPSILAGAVMFGGLILIYKGIRRRKEVGWISLEPWARLPRTYMILGAIFATLLFYILFSEKIGFLITSAVLLFGLMLWTRGGKRVLSSLIISMIFTIAVYLIFAKVLRVPLPRGLLEGIF